MSENQKETKEKTLEKMTVKDLREMAKKIPEITGVHGMKKDEIIHAIKDAKDIEDEPGKAIEDAKDIEDEPEKKKGPSIQKAKEKPLEKMTVKNLREMAKGIPEITGVHGMKKDEIIHAIEDAKDIEDEPEKKKSSPVQKIKKSSSVQEIKKKIRELKTERKVALEAKDKKMATIYKRRISRLKKRTRRAA